MNEEPSKASNSQDGELPSPDGPITEAQRQQLRQFLILTELRKGPIVFAEDGQPVSVEMRWAVLVQTGHSNLFVTTEDDVIPQLCHIISDPSEIWQRRTEAVAKLSDKYRISPVEAQQVQNQLLAALQNDPVNHVRSNAAEGIGLQLIYGQLPNIDGARNTLVATYTLESDPQVLASILHTTEQFIKRGVIERPIVDSMLAKADTFVGNPNALTLHRATTQVRKRLGT